MEYEISDDPQGHHDGEEANRDGGLTEDHRALMNQSSVDEEDYPEEERRTASLVRPKKKTKDEQPS